MLFCSLALLCSSLPCPLHGPWSPVAASGARGSLSGAAEPEQWARSLLCWPSSRVHFFLWAVQSLGEGKNKSHTFRHNHNFLTWSRWVIGATRKELPHQISAFFLHLFLTSFFCSAYLCFLSFLSSVKSSLHLLGVPVRGDGVEPWCHSNKGSAWWEEKWGLYLMWWTVAVSRSTNQQLQEEREVSNSLSSHLLLHKFWSSVALPHAMILSCYNTNIPTLANILAKHILTLAFWEILFCIYHK